MACFNPILAVDNGINSDTGKHQIHFLPQRADFNFEKARSRYGDSLMMLPCGHCVACAQDYARTWQARIMCEAQYYDKTCFLTLTYAKNPPQYPKKDDLRDFIKAVRNKYGSGIKFFGCGEKGSLTSRSHYHLILFGVDFSDDAIIQTKRGVNYIYSSKIADDLWNNKGFVSIGSLDVASAGYVSQYCNKKKIKGQDDGEFVIMSRGLGRKYFEDHYDDIFNSDYLYFAGNQFKIPRYFLKLALNQDDFYFKTKVWSFQDRKKEIALGFRYNSNKSFAVEEIAMKDDEKIKLDYLESKEGIRDVF